MRKWKRRAAIKSAVACPDNPAIADAFQMAVARQQTKVLLAERRRRQEEIEAAKRGTRQAVVGVLKAELTALMASDSEMPLLDAVEFVTPDPGDRLELYRSFKNSEHDTGVDHISTVASDVALLERRAAAEGFRS
jgi:hypothetical protein